MCAAFGSAGSRWGLFLLCVMVRSKGYSQGQNSTCWALRRAGWEEAWSYQDKQKEEIAEEMQGTASD